MLFLRTIVCYYRCVMKQNNKQAVHYDKEADVLAFYLSRGAEEAFVEIAPNVMAEFDKKGKLIGIEILNASKVLKPMLKSLNKKEAFAYSR